MDSLVRNGPRRRQAHGVCTLFAAFVVGACGPESPAAKRAPPATQDQGAKASPARPAEEDEGYAAFEALRRAVAKPDSAAFLASITAEDRRRTEAETGRDLDLLGTDAVAMANFRRETGLDRDLDALSAEEFVRLRLEQVLGNPRRRARLDMLLGTAYVRSSRVGDILRIEAKDPLGEPVATAWIREDGRWRASLKATGDATARVLGRFRPGGGIVEHLAFSPDGRRIAEWSEDKLLRIWDLDHPAEPRVVGTVEGFPTAFVWRDDGTIAMATLEGKLLLFPEAGGAPRIGDLGNNPGEFRFAGIPRGGDCYALSWARGMALELRDIATGETKHFLSFDRTPSRAFAISPDGSRLAVSTGHRVALYDAATGNLVWNLPGVREWIRLEFGTDGRFLGGLEKGGYIRLWECATGLDAGKTRARDGDINSAFVVLPGGRIARAGERDIRFAAASSSRIRNAELGLRAVTLATSRDGLRVAAGFTEEGFVILDAAE